MLFNPFVLNAPLRFSDVFRGYRKGAFGTSGLIRAEELPLKFKLAFKLVTGDCLLQLISNCSELKSLTK